METAREPITFAAVARTAHVSTWLVYAEGVREHTSRRPSNANRPTGSRPTRRAHPSTARLRVDLELARQETATCAPSATSCPTDCANSAANWKAIAAKDLIARIDELTRHNQHLADQAQQATAHNDSLQARVAELETDLAAARTSLRRMIRNGNRSTQCNHHREARCSSTH